MKLYTILTASVATFAIALPALAGPVGIQRQSQTVEPSQVLAQLQEAKQENARQARMTHGSAEQMYLMKVVSLDNLIKRVQSGESVSPEEIDRALQD